ncbi:MAG: hypothetical protein IKF90_04835 [Parasporobacterium sp.]|nr:hypothetical protein [Parasporobacterium sp.]
MEENNNSKCPYCGSSLMEEEDGYRCRLCKSFFPFDSDPEAVTEPHISAAEKEKEDAEKAFQRVRIRNELIGMATAFVSAGLLFFSKIQENPYLLIPGFILWAFSAGYTGFQIYKAKKNGQKAAYVRIFLLLIVAILIVLFVKPSGH